MHAFASVTRPRFPLTTWLAWLWLFLPLVWMWPNARSAAEVALSALLLMGALLSRATTRVAVVLLWALGMVFLAYFYSVHSLPDEFLWQSILGSNPGEAWEFLGAYRLSDAGRLLLWAVPALWAAGHLWRQPRVLRHRLLRALAWLTVALWVLWLGISSAKGYDIYRTFSRVDRIYPLMIVNSWERYTRNAVLFTQAPQVQPPSQLPMVDVLVVVLGESASAHRWSLLGYPTHATNAPLQPWQSGLVSLPLTTNGNNTGKTLPVIMAGQALQPMPETGMASYLDLARTAGFQNHVLANQQAPGFANMALRMRSDSYLQLQDGKLDGELSDLLAQALQERSGPLVVTLHTYGSHPRVEKRYPPDAAQWSDPYDNSLYYTSQLLANWIAQLQALSPLRTALVYVSDHGQDFPVCGGSYTHGVTRSTYEVPFLLWSNAALRSQQPDWWQQWVALAQHAVDDTGIPRHHTLLPAQAIAQLLGHAATSMELPPADSVAGPYPPAADASMCTDWFPSVQRLHPAAVQ